MTILELINIKQLKHKLIYDALKISQPSFSRKLRHNSFTQAEKLVVLSVLKATIKEQREVLEHDNNAICTTNCTV